MYHAETWREKIVLFLSILWPIIVTQVSFFAMKLIDTMMAGRVGTDDLAGVAIGSSLWMPIFTGMNGILLAVTPIVAQLIGSNERHRIADSVRQALYVALMLAIAVVGAGTLVLEPVLAFMKLEPNVAYISYHYLAGLALGIIPLFCTNVLRYFFDAQGYTRITMVITVLALPCNAVLNYGLIFGHFGLPALGGIGAGYATAITYWIMFVISVTMTFRIRVLRQYRLFQQWVKPSLRAWKEQLRIGVPMGLSIFFEASIFSVVTLMMGRMFATVTVAAHQIAFNFTSLIFMIPLSISMALTIVVGFSVGAGNLQAAKQYGKLGVLSGIGILGISALFLYFLREPIAYLYTTEREVVLLASQFFIFAIFYQISDAAQSGLQGVLRGYKDVKLPFVTAFISYWLIGIPTGYLLASTTALGPFGFWIGITLGLTCAALGFFLRLRVVQLRVREQAQP
ncbi:MATE family efflux transporter [Alkalihalobacillus oceani]|uniref:MATE family efflux transporter n=1 Tax=Halalkalibacter oceani TaxID=1653776 RepID=UPI00203CF70D|nr:MATE family efflux transporter [Halalkalibacter oceani]MCM3761732.1 MATE family efflux transporter [Halalkalibacter oceani]